MAVTLSQIKVRARQLADMENSSFIGDTELTSMVNASYYELYDLILDSYQDYYVSSSTVTLTTAEAGVYALPATFYKIKGLDLLIGADYVTVQPFTWNERNRNNRGRSSVRYRLVGSNLVIEPADSAPGTYKLWYVPALTALSASGDNIDSSITRAGWEEYIAIDCAVKMREKEESDISGLQRMKDRMIGRITAASANRDTGSPDRVSDTSRRIDYDGEFEGWNC